jgi:hypothetical protein
MGRSAAKIRATQSRPVTAADAVHAQIELGQPADLDPVPRFQVRGQPFLPCLGWIIRLVGGSATTTTVEGPRPAPRGHLRLPGREGSWS